MKVKNKNKKVEKQNIKKKSSKKKMIDFLIKIYNFSLKKLK